MERPGHSREEESTMMNDTRNVYRELAEAAPALPLPVLMALARLVLKGRPVRLDTNVGGTLVRLEIIPPTPRHEGGRAQA
jgi:hypothetical protein